MTLQLLPYVFPYIEESLIFFYQCTVPKYTIGIYVQYFREQSYASQNVHKQSAVLLP